MALNRLWAGPSALVKMRLAIALLTAITLFAADDDWAHYRGPNRDGVARGDVPLEFSLTRNLAWKTRIPGRGHSSPVIWGDRIFLSTAIPTGAANGYAPAIRKEHRLLVMCLDRNTGKVLWERSPKTVTPRDAYQVPYGSYASNIPVTDGRRVYFFWESRGIFVYDLDGKLEWQKDFPQMHKRGEFGEGTPTMIDGDTLYLKFDQEQNSHLIALDKNNGNELWRVNRDEPSSWSPPLMATYNGRKQLLVAGTKVTSYDPATGKVNWECAGLGLNSIPSPVSANGVVYAMTGFQRPNLMAIRIDRQGVLTGTDAVLWSNNRGIPYNPSPVLKDDILYFISDTAMLSAFKADTGVPYYHQQRLSGAYSLKSSPVAVNGKLYIATEQGDVVVVRMGEKFEVLATNSMGDDMFIATPAVAGNSMYLRGQNMLYCIRRAN
jgi:outer membrane protein assembly factor BamB